MKSFVINKHGKLVLPSHVFPKFDFSNLHSVDQLSAVVKRDFDDKSPDSNELLRRIEAKTYANRYELLRDLSLHLFWVNRFSITMYEKRPVAWGHVPKRRDDVFIPIVKPWQNGAQKIQAVKAEYDRLPAAWDASAEHRIFSPLFDVFSNRRHQATELPPIKPTVAEILEDPENLTFHVSLYSPDYPTFSYEQIVDCHEDVPELEALRRWTMVLWNQYPWHREHIQLIQVGKLRPDDVVTVFYPRSSEILQFIRRVKAPKRATATPTSPVPESTGSIAACRPMDVRKQFSIQPRLEGLAAVKGEVECTNTDLVRNAAYNWSPMSATDITKKTGIECRRYTARSLEDMSLEAARRALDQAGRNPKDVGAVVFCSCTSTRLIPSIATWLSGQLGIFQTHASFDIVAACAGMIYGLAEAVRLLQHVERPVLLVCAEKFSDKIGSVRPSRMIFGDGAVAMLIGPAAAGAAADLEFLQTYASGPFKEVNSIIWPNPAFDNSITVYGPDVQSLVSRYLRQMMQELQVLRDPDDPTRPLMDTIDLVVPHQANRTMVTRLAVEAGLPAEKLYFNIDRVGNTSAASIGMAICDAVADGIIDRPLRIFTPAFGAGAVAGYAVMRVHPKVVANEDRPDHSPPADVPSEGTSLEDVRAAFAE